MDNLKHKATWRRGPAGTWLTALAFSLAALFTAQPAYADIAPPEPPPGSNIGPGNQPTHVQMVWEKVILSVTAVQSAKPALAGDVAAAKVTATFSMRNQGTAPEQMTVRFPLSNPDGSGDGTLNNWPEIRDLQARVNQQGVSVGRITTPNPFGAQYPAVPWAVFNVTFPAGQDVLIDVTYTDQPQGYLPFGTFHYILETGAGWQGPIGAADLTLTLPYAADAENVIPDENYYPGSTPGGQISGNDIHWHFDNLEPTAADNFEVSLILPVYWEDILRNRQAVSAGPKDGDAWGALAKACKHAMMGKGGVRPDAGGQKLYAEAVDAYERALALQPKVAKWHAGYAELLWWAYRFSGTGDPAVAERMAQELKAALELEPENAQALGLLDQVSSDMPDIISNSSSGYTFLVLTALPTALPATALASPAAPTPTPAPATPTARAPTATATLAPSSTLTEAPPTPSATPPTPTPPARPGGGLCGAAALAPVIVVGLMGLRRRRAQGGRR